MKRLLLLGVITSLLSCSVQDPVQPGLLVPKTVDQDPGLPSLMINGTQLHVEAFGKSTDPIIVMIHGGPGGDYRSMLKCKAFADDGFYAVFYDQRGAGLSKREGKDQFGEQAIQLMIDDLDELIRHFRLSSDQKVFLYGHSWGAMLATAYVNQNPEKIDGVILAEPGGFTWTQTSEYLSRSNEIQFFSEALNNAVYTEQIFAGRSEHEILDYKSSYFSSFENAPGNTIGNAGPYPFWRSGAVAFSSMIDLAEDVGFDFTTDLDQFQPNILFLYSELNQAYGKSWAETVSAPYPTVELAEVTGSGHELTYFGWDSFYPQALAYLISLK